MKSRSSLHLLASLSLAALALTAHAARIQDRVDDDVVRILRAPLAANAKVNLERVPLDGSPETLQVERFEVWEPEATIVAQDGPSITKIARPATRFFRGRIAGNPDSLVFLSVDEGITGFVTTGQRRFKVSSNVRKVKGKPAEVATFIEEASDDDEIPPDGQTFVCGTEGEVVQVPHDAALLKPGVLGQLIQAPLGTLGTGTALRSLTMAIEVDSQLYANLGSSTGNVNTFIGNLVGAASVIYQRDLRTELTIIFTRIQTNSGTDPFLYPGQSGTWNGTTQTFNTQHALAQLGDIWHASPPFGSPRSAVVRLSGSTTLAGVGWIGTICGSDFLCSGGQCGSAVFDNHYGGEYAYCGGLVAGTGISTTIPDPNAVVNGVQYELPSTNYWSLLEFSHELGHVVAAIHTHCEALTSTEQAMYGVSRPYVDLCASGECYVGPTSAPSEGGTIMSYCHLLGASNSRYLFGVTGQPSEKVVTRMVSALTNKTPNSPTISAPSSINNGQTLSASIGSPVAGQSYSWTITNGTLNGSGTSATGTSVNFSGSANPVTLRARTQFDTGGTAGCGATDFKSVTFVVCVAPGITTQPGNVSISAGNSTTLAVVATGTTLAYQWYTGNSGDTSTPIGGATGSSVQVSPTSNTNYWVRISNGCGSIDSNAATVTVCPAISVQPQGLTLTSGASTTLSVTTIGPSVTYQWYQGASGNSSTPIGGATNGSVTVSPTVQTSYWVRLTGPCGTLDSATATIDIAAPAGSASTLFLLTPCRLIDTRNPAGPLGGPSIGPNTVRTVQAAGNCGIPVDAKSIATNVTTINAASAGWLTIYPADAPGVPFVSTINYLTGIIRGNNAALTLSADGKVNVYNSGPFNINFVIDVTGYFK